MQFRDPARDGQTESCPLRLTARAVAAVEALEDPGQLIGGNANSGVRDDHRAFAVSGCNIQPDASTLRCVLDRVVEYDQQQPLDEPRVTHDLRLLERPHGQGHPFPLRQGSRGADRLRGDVVEGQRSVNNLPLAGVGARQCEQVSHNSPEPFRFPLDRLKRGPVARGIARLRQRHLCPGAQNRHRGAQLVCRVCHESAHLLHRAFNGDRRLPRQQEPAQCDHDQSRERGGTEDPDQACVLLPNIGSLADCDSDIRGAGPAGEALGMQPRLLAVGHQQLRVMATRGRRRARCSDDPRIGCLGCDRTTVRVEEVQVEVRDVQLLHRVRSDTGSALGFQVMSRALDRRGRRR